VIGVAAAIVLTAETMRVASVTYTSYFDEAVTGLEVGSPVRYRGVKIGNVSAIDVAPDQRHVEIVYSLGVKVLSKLRLAGTSHGKETRILLPPDLRVQLAITGLTGTKFLQIDFFDTAGEPPVLPFPVPENYIPATASTMKNLEEAVVRAVGMMPHIAQQLDLALSRTNAILDDLDRRGLPGKASTSLDNANQLLATLQRKLSQVRVDDLSRDAAATLEDASATLVKMKGVLDHLDGNDGLFASVQRTSDSLNDVAGPRLGATFHETERDLREAAVAVRQLVEALQRDPDMFLKGKTKVRQ